MSIDDYLILVKKIQDNLSDDLRWPRFRDKNNKFLGHCYVASEAFYHLVGGKDSGFKPYQMNVNGESHWFLEKGSRIRIDITAKQFDYPLDYMQAKGKGFLTKKPSKRAQILMKRVLECQKLNNVG